LASGSSFHR
jgi:hypothetical protein